MKSIKSKILLRMILTVVISLSLIGAVGSYLNYTSTYQTLENMMQETAVVAAGRVAEELRAYTNVALEAGSIARLADPSGSVAVKKEIINQRVSTHGFQRGNIIGTDGISIFDGKDYSDRQYYQMAMQGKAHVSEPLISKITGELSIMVAAPLWKGGIPDTEIAGVVYFVPEETFLNDIMSNVQISANGAAYAINAEGYTIADNTLETIMTQHIEEESKTDPSLVQLAQIHAKMRQGLSGFGEYQINGVHKFMAYAPIGQTDGWSMGITAPKSDFMGATYAAIFWTIALLFVSIIVAVLIAVGMANDIGRPVELCTMRIEKLAAGDLKSEVPRISNRDETGKLAAATQSIVQTMDGIITDMGTTLYGISQGDFTAQPQRGELYIGDFQPLSISIYQIIDQLSKTLSQINLSAEQVASGSEQVSAGAQALSQGATEQASSVEELAATINEISGHVQGNADSARQASAKANHVGEEIAASNQKMQDLIAAMKEISESSESIGKVIKVIEDIAFQTNILSLNASVEAARAGAAGKGFAVVADEVRNLAGKSAEASQSTAAMIERSLQAVENGTKLADDAAKSMLTVVQGAHAVIDTVEQITSASQEQAHSISQVTLGIDQISSVVQTNSATAEESAAASEELSSQAQMLKNLVGKFILSSDKPEEKLLR